MKRVLLGVNIDHVATLRQARGTRYPEPVQAALVAEQAGADGITVHLREDRRHIQDRDVEMLMDTVQTRIAKALEKEGAVFPGGAPILRRSPSKPSNCRPPSPKSTMTTHLPLPHPVDLSFQSCETTKNGTKTTLSGL